MTKRKNQVPWLVILVMLLATVPLLAQTRQIPTTSILTDQFGMESRIGQLTATRTVVVIYSAERKADDYLKAWHQGLRTKLPMYAVLLAVADLDSLPFFIPKRAIIRQLATDHPDMPILLDWKGTLGPMLSVGKDKATATVYSGGRLQRLVAGEYTVEKAEILLEIIPAIP